MAIKRKALWIIMLILAILFFVIAGSYSWIRNNLTKLAEIEIRDVDISQKNDGVYFGSFKAFPVAVELEVTIQNHEITRIDLLKHDNGQGTAAEAITDTVVELQTLEVDVISGATYSSKVILKAIENALMSE
ncbi:MAG: FMN-binding protein [Saccharofermentanales bacterium]